MTEGIAFCLGPVEVETLIRYFFGDVRQLDKWSLEILSGILAEDTELGMICCRLYLILDGITHRECIYRDWGH